MSIAKALSAKGANITLIARNAQLMQKITQEELFKVDEKQTHNFHSIDMKDIASLAENFPVENHRDCSILINCAGLIHNKLLVSTPNAEVVDILNLNLVAPILLTKLVVKNMLKKRQGHIINISSIIVEKLLKGATAYISSKAGLIGFTRSLAFEVGSRNVRCNAILPGLIPSTEMGEETTQEMFTSVLNNGSDLVCEDIANAVIFLVENESITGECISIDKGFKLS